MRDFKTDIYYGALNGAYSGVKNSPFTISIVEREEPDVGYVVTLVKLASWPNISSVNTALMCSKLRDFVKNFDLSLLYITIINSVDGVDFFVSIIIDDLEKAKNIANIHNMPFILNSKTKQFINV